MKQTIYLAALGALIATGAAVAQEPAMSGKGGQWLMQMDQDGDGKVTAAEMTAAAKAHFDEADANDDGKLSSDEMRALREMRRGMRRVARLDQDGDQMLSFEELTSRRDPAKLIARLDTNGDDAIDAAEFAEGRKKMRKGDGERCGNWAEHRKEGKGRNADCDRS